MVANILTLKLAGHSMHVMACRIILELNNYLCVKIQGEMSFCYHTSVCHILLQTV